MMNICILIYLISYIMHNIRRSQCIGAHRAYIYVCLYIYINVYVYIYTHICQTFPVHKKYVG